MSILKADPSQFRINDAGLVTYQKTLNNPLEGDVVAKLSKGKTLMLPEIKLEGDFKEDGVSEEQVLARLQEWLSTYINEALEPLKKIQDEETKTSPVKDIKDHMVDALGVIHRSELEKYIADLDEEKRKVIRSLRIKLGPILVFLPELNKPKAVRVRAILWALWNDKALPVAVPPDGSVSVSIDPEEVDRNFYRSISYPVFGPKAIRIDMLDRVLNEIYETAENGKFRAQHKMAEWLGCSIDDLYAILQAMGNNRIVSKKAEGEQDGTQDNKEDKAESKEAEKPADKNTDVKPELDEFWLKKGQAHKKKAFKAKPKSENKKPSKGKSKSKPSGPKVISTGPKPKLEDSPFAILGQLKDQGK